jgi:Endoribonuclease L-PSP
VFVARVRPHRPARGRRPAVDGPRPHRLIRENRTQKSPATDVPEQPRVALGELILEQMKTALEAAGSDLDHVLKCNVLCISADRFKVFNEIYKRYFPKNPPARIFFCVPQWTGPFDIEIDCVAVTKADRLPTLRPLRLTRGDD